MKSTEKHTCKKCYTIVYQPERSKREDKCNDPNHKEYLGGVQCDTCFKGLVEELDPFFGLKNLMRCSEHSGN